MGGFGSGRQGGKGCTDDMHALTIGKIQRAERLMPGQSFAWQWTCNGEKVASINMQSEAGQVILKYRTRSDGADWRDMDYPVRVDWTSCYFGGQRAWWLCPAAGCGRRVAVLFGGSVFACRHCHNLAYRSQREQFHDRASRRADKIRDRLQWEPGILNGNGIKPKGMHWATFERFEAAHDAYVNQSLAGMAAIFGLAMGRLQSTEDKAGRL